MALSTSLLLFLGLISMVSVVTCDTVPSKEGTFSLKDPGEVEEKIKFV